MTTTTMAKEQAPKRAERATRAAHRSGEALVFAGATAVGFVHALDDAFFHRQPGVGLGQHALAAAISLVVGLGAIVAFPSMRPAARSAVALLFGALATVNGMLHVSTSRTRARSGAPSPVCSPPQPGPCSWAGSRSRGATAARER